MQLYHFLSKIKFLYSYSFKLLTIAFVGIQIPIVGLAVLLSFNTYEELGAGQVLLVAFGLTFLSAALNLLALHQMVVPVRKAKNALLQYLRMRKLPDLPSHYTDEVGVLMNSVQATISNLDHLLQEKQDLMALLSHDIRSPLNTSSSLAELIRIKSGDEEIRQYSEKILEQNQKQLQLMNAVLQLLREDQEEQVPTDFNPVLLEELVQEALQGLSVELEQKEISVRLHIPKNLTIQVKKAVFLQVLVNLIHNAIKFSPRKKEITINAGLDVTDVQIDVRDEGIGFANEHDLNKIFDRFTSLKRMGTEGEPTTGVGLYLSRKIVRQHKGELKAYSKGINKGSTFRITIPA